MYQDPNLEEDSNGYVYYEHSKYPLMIDYLYDEDRIWVKVSKYFKNHLQSELEVESKVLKPMGKYQIEDYILDVVYKFLKK